MNGAIKIFIVFNLRSQNIFRIFHKYLVWYLHNFLLPLLLGIILNLRGEKLFMLIFYGKNYSDACVPFNFMCAFK